MGRLRKKLRAGKANLRPITHCCPAPDRTPADRRTLDPWPDPARAGLLTKKRYRDDDEWLATGPRGWLTGAPRPAQSHPPVPRQAGTRTLHP